MLTKRAFNCSVSVKKKWFYSINLTNHIIRIYFFQYILVW